MRARSVASALAFALLATACQGATEPVDLATIGGPSVAETPSASPSETDEWAVPDPITVEYIERVILDLERQRALFFDAIRDLEPGTQIPESAIDILRGFNTATFAEATLAGYQAWVDDPESPLRDMARPAGPRVPTRPALGQTTAECISLTVNWDLSRLFVNGEDETEAVVLLVMKPSAEKHWEFSLEGEWNREDFTPQDGAEWCSK